MKKHVKKIPWILTAAVFAGMGVWAGFFIKNIFFPAYEPCIVIQQKELSSPEYGTYLYRGTADQTEYESKLKQKPIGETQTGYRIIELKNDPDHQYFVLVFNTEMPWWDLYEKK